MHYITSYICVIYYYNIVINSQYIYSLKSGPVQVRTAHVSCARKKTIPRSTLHPNGYSDMSGEESTRPILLKVASPCERSVPSIKAQPLWSLFKARVRCLLQIWVRRPFIQNRLHKRMPFLLKTEARQRLLV